MRILYRSKARLVCLGVWVACWIRHLRARLTRARNARCWMISCGSFVRASGDLHFFWTFVGHIIPLPLPNHLVFFFRIFPQPTQFHACHLHFISIYSYSSFTTPIYTLSFLYFLPGSRFFFTVRRFGYLVATLSRIIPTLFHLVSPFPRLFIALTLRTLIHASRPHFADETNITMS